MIKKIFKSATIGVLLLNGMTQSYARAACSKTTAKTTTYYTPDVQKICGGSKPCSKFRSEVRMQGSGTLPGNRILTYNGKIKNLGDCDTTVGAAGTCMKPYVTVAADPRYYNMGDIIYIPSFQGVKIKLDDGGSFVHHGYFMVEDTGGAIKGANRFDIYTGAANLVQDDINEHLVEMGITDKSDCSSIKNFRVLRKGSKGYSAALNTIERRSNSIEVKVASTAAKGAN